MCTGVSRQNPQGVGFLFLLASLKITEKKKTHPLGVFSRNPCNISKMRMLIDVITVDPSALDLYTETTLRFGPAKLKQNTIYTTICAYFKISQNSVVENLTDRTRQLK